jgi:hypothetical protein
LPQASRIKPGRKTGSENGKRETGNEGRDLRLFSVLRFGFYVPRATL